jgi:hypothetical protein
LRYRALARFMHHLRSVGFAHQVVSDDRAPHIVIVLRAHGARSSRSGIVLPEENPRQSASFLTGIAGLEFALESAEPHRLGPWMEFEQVFRKTLTAEEANQVREWPDVISINGKAKFEDHIEKDFSIRSALYRPVR